MSKSKKRYSKYCCIYGCTNKSIKESEFVFFNVPKETERRREWLKAIDREDLLDEKQNKAKFNYVCSAHFDDSDMITTTTIFTRLKGDAIPTKILPQKSTEDPQSSKDRSSRKSNKSKILVSTYSHTQCQTETEIHNEFPYEVDVDPQSKPNIVFMNIEPEIAKTNLNAYKSFNKNPTQKSAVIEPTTSKKLQSKVSSIKNKVSISTQTDSSKSLTIGRSSSISDKRKPEIIGHSPMKRKTKKEIEFVECKRRRPEDDFKIQSEFESKNASLITNSEDKVTQRIRKLVEWQNKIKNKFNRNCYDARYKIFTLHLHYASPQAYRYFQTVLKLPRKSTLNRFKFTVPPKLDDRVLESLSLKVKSLPSNAKYCTICVSEMILKRHLYYDIKKDEVIGLHNIDATISPEIANSAYVVMLQGIYCKWKQPIAYALLGSTTHYAALDSWMNKVILKLFGIGVEVKAVISEQGSYFDKYAKVIKNVAVDRPYFFVENHKIYYLFDVPNLLKCVRDNLLLNDFYFKKDKISWEHVKTLYEYQKDKNLMLIPKITNAHIEPNSSQKRSVKYAVQILSNTVYAALETYIDFGKITAEAKGTAKFIKIMNDLFDVLNSSKMKCDKKYQSAFSMTTDQKSILQDAQHMFATMKSTNRNTEEENTNEVKTFQNFQITIQSVLQIFEDLKLEGFEHLFTRRLNGDNLDVFLESIRQQCSSSSEPTPIQFTRAFSKLFHEYMLKSDHTNCESDIYDMLHKAEDIIKKVIRNPPDLVRPSLVALNGETDYRMVLPDTNALIYVAGFLLFKCSRKHKNCKEFHKKLDSSINLDQNKFTNYKIYNKEKSFYGNLKIPSKEIIQYVQQLEMAFTRNFEHHLRYKPGSEIFKILQKVQLPTFPCLCFPVDYLLRLFVRHRVFSTLKSNNRSLKLLKKSNKPFLKVKPL